MTEEFLKSFVDISKDVTDDALNELDKLTINFVKNNYIDGVRTDTIYKYFAYLRDEMTDKNFNLIHLYFGEIEIVDKNHVLILGYDDDAEEEV